MKKIPFFWIVSSLLVCLYACDDTASNSQAPESSATNIELESSATDETSEGSADTIPESSAADAVPESSAAETTADTVWNRANLTWYTSWPDPESEECIEYNGCTWAGWFAGLEEQQTEEWVSQHNIIAIHEKDWDTYKLKTFRLRKGGYTIDAVVYDKCSDSDCDGCCTQNAGKIGFLIDIESYTRERFNGQGSGTVEWTCLDCD